MNHEQESRPAAGGRARLPRILWLQVAAVYVVASAVFLVALHVHRQGAIGELKGKATELAASHAENVQARLEHGLSATYAIAVMVREGDGDFPQFASVATQMLRVYRGISALQLAPAGVITQIVPLAGNEGALGHDLFQDVKRNKEAVLARATGQLTLAGPFKLIQGGVGMVGRLPIYLDDRGGRQRFWGFSTVLIRVEEFLRAVELERLSDQGYDYQLSRLHPDSGERELIASSPRAPSLPVHYDFAVPNGSWRLSLSPAAGWYAPLEAALEDAFALFLSLVVTILSAYRLRQPFLLRRQVEARTRELTAANLALRRAGEAIREGAEQQRKLARVIEQSPVSIMITDAKGAIEYVNPKFCEATGYTVGEVLGANPRFLKSGEMSADEYARLWQTISLGNEWRGVLHNRRKNGEMFWENATISPVIDEAGTITHYVAVKEDITDRRAIEERMEFLAHHDFLTGLPNRILLHDRLDQAMAQIERSGGILALGFLDLDRFKVINDTLGHAAGDALLQEVARRLRACVRETDTVSRLGGDEFVVILNGARDFAAVQQTMEKIQAVLGVPLRVAGQELAVTFSIGIALHPDDGGDFDTLLKKADTAMYHAKDAGRNTYRFFTEQMNVNALERLRITQELRRALESDELCLFYQPQIDLADGRIFGVEALIRWRHPERGLILPGGFIPVAEDSGLIVPIGNWVLREACRQGRAWQDAGLAPLSIAVNVSAIQFRRGDLDAEVAVALAESGFPAARLELEITETALIEDPQAVQKTLARLKALGVRLAIDDFGTGYSSLSYLKRFRVDKLKVDQSFVRDVETDADDASLVTAIVQMAKSLKLRTIAEGVEGAGVLAFLRRAGCDEAQGYHFGRPEPAAVLAARLAATPQTGD